TMGVDAGRADGWAGDMVPTPALLQALQLLRTSLPEANVYTCEYEPLQGVIAITDPNGITTRYEYDGFNRLTRSYYLDSDSDSNKVLLQQYLYHLGEK
uniref:RHS repeat domain-containing protein n=1 Tax=Bacteroides faecichinchillae TaxID=871325 RepID=UPI0011DD62B6